MNEPPTADEILADIEFEILQGALGQDDMGQALEAARRFHLRSRHELLSTDSRQRDRQLAGQCSCWRRAVRALAGAARVYEGGVWLDPSGRGRGRDTGGRIPESRGEAR